MAYVRFVASATHQGLAQGAGLFVVAYLLYQSDAVSESDRETLNELLRWFDDNLSVPERFNRTTSKGYYRRTAKGISWLRDTASEHISNMRKVQSVVEEYGYSVDLIKTDRIGYVTYEDEVQAVAEPFSDTPVNS